jgi:ADP-heptose:LPS heptosyltransferase
VREPRAGEVEDPAEQADFFAAMRAEGFDLALQMHGGGRYSNVFVSRLGARWSVGLRTPDAAPLDLCLHYSYYQPEIPRLLELVGLVGAAPQSLEPLITVTDQDRAEAEQALADLHQPVVALHPGATDPRRRWPPEHFAAVGDALAADGASIVLTGSGTEQAVVAEVADRMLAPARPLVDAVTLGGLAGTYARCALVVSNDTGPRHLAQAVGAATVAIYWCGNLINAGPLTRQRHRPHVSWTVHCPVCGADTTQPPPPGAQNRCEHDPSFVSSVSVHAVRADALDLLAAEAGRRRPVG